jgi:hypothetical protein
MLASEVIATLPCQPVPFSVCLNVRTCIRGWRPRQAGVRAAEAHEVAGRQVSVKPRRHRAASSSQQLRAQVVCRFECSAGAVGITFNGAFLEQPAGVNVDLVSMFQSHHIVADNQRQLAHDTNHARALRAVDISYELLALHLLCSTTSSRSVVPPRSDAAAELPACAWLATADMHSTSYAHTRQCTALFNAY